MQLFTACVSVDASGQLQQYTGVKARILIQDAGLSLFAPVM